MIQKLKDLVKNAKSKHEALESLHIELQNVKIQLLNKGYKIITTPGPEGPDFDEMVEDGQIIHSEDKELVEYFKTLHALKKASDDLAIKSNYSFLTADQDYIGNLLNHK